MDKYQSTRISFIPKSTAVRWSNKVLPNQDQEKNVDQWNLTQQYPSLNISSGFVDDVQPLSLKSYSKNSGAKDTNNDENKYPKAFYISIGLLLTIITMTALAISIYELVIINKITTTTTTSTPISAWTVTSNMTFIRRDHMASVLQNGKVLVTGGYAASVYLNSAELYDPSTGIWTTTNNMNSLRAYLQASILPNGKVAELYDPSTAIWTSTININYARAEHTASVLSNGKVLVTGGVGSSVELNSAELY